MTISDKSNVSDAFSAWGKLLGAKYARNSEEAISEYSASLIPESASNCGVVLPKTFSELQEVLSIATKNKVSLYPISCGKNWGYGASCPVQEGNVILDLSRMNQILEYDETLGYVVVEPGVTPEQLYNYLEDHGGKFIIDTIGGPSDSSLLGNILERGYGLGNLGDHFLHSSGIEALLADGTHYSRVNKGGASSKFANIYKWGVGPYLDGIFTQSNFGVVTKLAIWLATKPESYGIVIIKAEEERQLSGIIESIRALKLNGVIPQLLHLYNDVRILSSLQQFPSSQTDKKPLSEEVKAKLRKRHGISLWNGVTAISGTKQEVRLRAKMIKKSLRGKAQVQYVSGTLIDFLIKHTWLVRFIGLSSVATKVKSLQIFKGIPSYTGIKSVYWRSKNPLPDMNDKPQPQFDNCGTIWCSPLTPMIAKDCFEVIRITRDICESHGFEFNTAMNFISSRAINFINAISFDKSNALETQNALNCYNELNEILLKKGYVSYRSSTIGMQYVIDDSPYWDVCKKIKIALDPNGIIAPGRYEK